MKALRQRLRIVVTGLAATYPLGGVFWDYLQYVAGMARLGHEVIYLEDTGKWCYDPAAHTFVERGNANAAYLAREIRRLMPEADSAWFFRDAAGQTFGMAWPKVVEFVRSADLFLHISGCCCMREEYLAANCVACIDSDPMYSQGSIPGYVAGEIDSAARARVDTLRRHDVFFTFAENFGAPDCRVPTEMFDWRPTRQPIVQHLFAPFIRPVEERRKVITTVASWESTEGAAVVTGIRYGGKSVEFEKFLGLPAASPLPLELAISGRAPLGRLEQCGWKLLDGFRMSSDPWVYRDYLATSFAEWSVAKNAYVASRSGWFSCRSACYLALGVPVIVQDTGFSRHIEAHEGLIAFSTLEEAVEAIRRVAAEPKRHARAARATAAEFFDSDKVLGRLIEEALAPSAAQVPAP